MTIRDHLSWKRLVREKTSGKRLSGERLPGRMTIRESYYPGNDCKPTFVTHHVYVQKEIRRGVFVNANKALHSVDTR